MEYALGNRSHPMRLSVTIIAVLLATVATPSPAADDVVALTKVAEAAYEKDIKPLLATYCVKCHGGEKTKGEVNVANYKSGSSALGARHIWRKVTAELSHGEMPPEKEKQPSEAESKLITTWIASLRKLDPPDAGRVTIRRLNRAEYNNTIRDLMGVDWKPATDFPADDVGDGFDNIGDVLSISPLLMEKYLLAADAILDKLVVDDQVAIKQAAGQLNAIVDGKADAGKADGTTRTFTLPGEVFTNFGVNKEAKYTIRIRAGAEQAGKEPVRLAVKIDGQVVSEIKVMATAKSPTAYTCTVPLGPGGKRLSVIFMNPYTETPEDMGLVPKAGTTAGAPVAPPRPPTAPAGPKPKEKEPPKPKVRTAVIDSIEVLGPSSGSPTELHKRLFIAVPGKDLGKREAAQKIAERFAQRAYRKPPTKEQLALLLKIFDLGDSQGETFSESVKLMLKAVLVSPHFFFRMEDDRPGDKHGNYRISDWDLASRLSYFIWSSMPDDELFTLAGQDKLHDPATLDQQVRRMLKDAKSRAFVDNFAGQWLLLRNVFVVTPDDKKFPELTKELRQAMYDEATLVFETIMREDRSLIEFLDSDYTFLNDRLAKHYGISGVSGAQMRKVQLADRTRGGVLTMGSLLTVTSNPTRTSPVKRGKWVLEEVLGTPPPPPPPMVEGLEKQDNQQNSGLSLRQRMEKHRADPTCASCHKVMDQLGFGFENFDAIGRWRDRDADHGDTQIDASGELPGNVKFSGPAELKRILLRHQDDFTRCLTGKMMTYALGRKLQSFDDEAIERIAATVAKDQYHFQTLVVEIARSFPFQYRRPARD